MWKVLKQFQCIMEQCPSLMPSAGTLLALNPSSLPSNGMRVKLHVTVNETLSSPWPTFQELLSHIYALIVVQKTSSQLVLQIGIVIC